jgi:hypothetical protein
MPGYVGRLFDHFAQNPLDSRLSAWMQLEFGDEAPAAHTGVLSSAIKAVGERQAQGAIDPVWDPFDLVMLLVGVAHTMATTGLSTRGLGVERSQVTTQRRAPRPSRPPDVSSTRRRRRSGRRGGRPRVAADADPLPAGQ